MKKTITILLFLFLILGLSLKVLGETPSLSEEEAYLLELINEARYAPLSMAEAMGKDRDQVLMDLPHLYVELTEGLPPLTINDKLYRAARGHTQEMVEYGFYSHVSMDGRTYEMRIKEQHYFPAFQGEALGMVAFLNFLPPMEAVEIIFQRAFLAELDPGAEKRHILNADIREAGMALGTGTIRIEGTPYNAYVATLLFGSPVQQIELAILNMLNFARAYPYQAFQLAGIDRDSAEKAYGVPAGFWRRPLQPLAWNEKLYSAAMGHTRDMISRGYLDTVSPEGLTPLDRVALMGYEPVQAGESLCLLAVFDAPDGKDPSDIARRIYENLLTMDVALEGNAKQRNLLDPLMREAGIRVERVPLYTDGGDLVLYYVVVADFAEPVVKQPFLVGYVFDDLNYDGFPDENEGISGLKTKLVPWDGSEAKPIEQETGPSGFYQISLADVPPGMMDLVVENGITEYLPVSLFLQEDDYDNRFMNVPIYSIVVTK